MKLDPQCKAALDLANKSVPKGKELDIPILMSALCHGTDLKEKLPEVAQHLPEPKPHKKRTSKVPRTKTVEEVFKALEKRDGVITAFDFFSACAETETGRKLLRECGVEESAISSLKQSSEKPKEDKPDHPKLSDEMMGICKRFLHIQNTLSSKKDDVSNEVLNQLLKLGGRMGFDMDDPVHKKEVEDKEKAEGDILGDWYDSLSIEHELHSAGNDLYKLGMFPESLECYDMALKINSDLLETYFNRGLCLTRMQRYKEAESDLTKVTKMNPRLEEAWYTRGLIYEYMYRYEKAVEDKKKV